MAYSDYTLEQATRLLGLTTASADLFAGAGPVEIPVWLPDMLGKGAELATINEKSRSEFIVVPILLASRDLTPTPLAIYSGQRLDVDSSRGLGGECDFILAASPPVPPLRAPIAIVVEVNPNDIEDGLGQCVAQMVGADLFNQAAGHSTTIFGCVTTGEVWQFLQLVGSSAIIDRKRFYLDDLSGILGTIQAVIARSSRPTAPGRSGRVNLRPPPERPGATARRRSGARCSGGSRP